MLMNKLRFFVVLLFSYKYRLWFRRPFRGAGITGTNGDREMDRSGKIGQTKRRNVQLIEIIEI